MTKQTEKACPKCASKEVYKISRVVGYFSRALNWAESKISELASREKGNYKI